MTALDTKQYWEDRLTREYSLGGVGWIGLGRAFNRWMYAVRGRVFARVVRAHVPLSPQARVLDVGSGTGFYLEAWRRLGVAAPEGSDLTERATVALGARWPDLAIHRFDAAGERTSLPPGSYDAISAMDVLFHIVDDAGFARALANLAGLLAPAGRLVFSDNFPALATPSAAHQVSRTEADIRRALAQAGLEPVAMRPMFVLLNTPVDTRSRLLRLWWSLLTRTATRGEALGFAAGAALYPLEVALTRVVRRGPSTKIMVCRRAGGS
ncbi:MAG: class I SAM-dependent methyltransferase [Solirubrobacteraceae bacterium]